MNSTNVSRSPNIHFKVTSRGGQMIIDQYTEQRENVYSVSRIDDWDQIQQQQQQTTQQQQEQQQTTQQQQEQQQQLSLSQEYTQQQQQWQQLYEQQQSSSQRYNHQPSLRRYNQHQQQKCRQPPEENHQNLQNHEQYLQHPEQPPQQQQNGQPHQQNHQSEQQKQPTQQTPANLTNYQPQQVQTLTHKQLKSRAKNIAAKKNKCLLCDHSSRTKKQLEIHVKAKHTPKKFKCNYCTFSSRLAGNLKTHSMKHTGDLPFKCKLCDFRYLYKSTLKQHLHKHYKSVSKQVKVLDCPYCRYFCINESDLDKHFYIHIADTIEQDIKRGIQITSKALSGDYSQTSLHQCEGCDFVTTCEQALDNHKNTHECIIISSESESEVAQNIVQESQIIPEDEN